MILRAIAEKLKRRSKDDFKGRHFEALLILQVVCWHLRYPLSYRDIEELFLERGLAVDHSTLNRWVLAYAPRSTAIRGSMVGMPFIMTVR
jgi:IS6 family transposase